MPLISWSSSVLGEQTCTTVLYLSMLIYSFALCAWCTAHVSSSFWSPISYKEKNLTYRWGLLDDILTFLMLANNFNELIYQLSICMHWDYLQMLKYITNNSILTYSSLRAIRTHLQPLATTSSSCSCKINFIISVILVGALAYRETPNSNRRREVRQRTTSLRYKGI